MSVRRPRPEAEPFKRKVCKIFQIVLFECSFLRTNFGAPNCPLILACSTHEQQLFPGVDMSYLLFSRYSAMERAGLHP